MWEIWSQRLLRREAVAFAPNAYALRHRRTIAMLRHSCTLLSVLALVAFGSTVPLLVSGWGSVLLSAVFTAVFLLAGFATIAGFRDDRKAWLLPYFARPLGDIDTFLGGEALLWHSDGLDAIARDLDCTPLSHFLSGDPLITDEECTLFPPDDALRTVTALCQSPRVATLDPAVGAYLKKLHRALHRAARDEVRFCLHLREGNAVSFAEMDLREGSYF